MKYCTKIIALLLLLVNTAFAGAQPRKVIYNENEIVLPNFLQYDTVAGTGDVINTKMDENLVYITWQTSKETNTSHFELQRSENGKDFEPIETITAVGISNNINGYATTDNKIGICCEHLYYRIKTVFVNGKELMSTPVVIAMNIAPSPLLYTMP